MSEKLRVLFAIPSLDRGGPDRVLFEVIEALDRRRFSPSVMVSEGEGHYLSQLPADVPVEVIGRGARYPVLPALRFVHRTRPDVVFATLRMIVTLGLVHRLLPHGTRLVVRPASPVTVDLAALVKLSVLKHRLARRVVLAALRNADGVVCQSRSMRTDLADVRGGVSNLYIVANPIDVAKIGRAAANEVTLPGAPSLVSVARLVPLKGYDLLLRALVTVRAQHPGVHLTIIGDGPERGRLETQVRELGLERTVSLVGYRPEPLPYVRAADLFVLASRYDAFPNSALEALACGTPIVLTDCPGANAELVRPGLNGELAAASEPGAVAQALDRAIANLGSYERAAITADCDARYATSRIVAQYEQVFADQLRYRGDAT